MSTTTELTIQIGPKSGPVRRMETLLDARRAITEDLPAGSLKTPHWQHAGWAVVRAHRSRELGDVEVATEALVHALECEGWMQRDLKELRMLRLRLCLGEVVGQLRLGGAPVTTGATKLTVVASGVDQSAAEQALKLGDLLRKATATDRHRGRRPTPLRRAG